MKINSLIKITHENIKWEDAIIQGVELLVKNNFCEPFFANKIIESVYENGPYFILLPRLALAHAAPGSYVKKNGLSLIILKNKVKFSDDEKHDVNLLFTLSALDGNSHMDLIYKFANIFQNDPLLIESLIKCNVVDEVIKKLEGLF